jgi:hypothetical protein
MISAPRSPRCIFTAFLLAGLVCSGVTASTAASAQAQTPQPTEATANAVDYDAGHRRDHARNAQISRRVTECGTAQKAHDQLDLQRSVIAFLNGLAGSRSTRRARAFAIQRQNGISQSD